MARPVDLAPAPSLDGRIRALSRDVVVAVAVFALLTSALTAVVFGVLRPRVDALTAATEALTRGHEAMLDEETGLRGYVTTGDPVFLQPYAAARTVLVEANRTADASLRGSSRLAAGQRELVAAQRRWTSGWARAAADNQPTATDNSTTVGFLLSGKALFDDYRGVHDRQSRSLAAARAGAERMQLLALAAAAAAELFGCLVLAILAGRAYRRLRAELLPPVDGLLDHIGAIRDGDLAPRGRLAGAGEFTVIGSGLDEMAGALAVERETRQRRENDLVLAQRTAETATAAKSAFLATMSHEIRTPMNAVIGLTGLLLETELDAEQYEFVDIVRTSGDSLLVIINDILDWSKIESGTLELDSQPFDLRICLEEALELFATPAAGKTLDLLLEVDPACPSVVVGDVTRMRQVLVNLLANAVKFTERGHVLLTARLLDAAPAGPPETIRLRLDVTDTGIGIPPDRIDRLFRSFSQVDASTTRTYGGTGLGLAISRRLAEAMAGQITVHSEPGVGSTFTVDVRLGVAGPECRAPVPIVPAELAGRHALVVDDNAVNRRILRAQLTGWGMRDDAAESGAEALRLLRTGRHYDVALFDLHMPGMDGLALLQQVRALPHRRDLPVMLLTSVSDRDAVFSGDRPPAAHLTKPVRAAVLRDTLAGVLGVPDTSPGSGVIRQRGPNAAPVPERSLRLLLAEDNAVNRRVAEVMLRTLGYSADVVDDGKAALAALRRTPYDVVLMDVQMPVMDGLEATRRLRRELPPEAQPWVLALTASALVEDRDQCAAAGMDDYLAKPVHREDLAAALARAPRRPAELESTAPPA